MGPILEVRHVSKTYTLAHERAPYQTLRDSLANLFRRRRSTSEPFDALQHVNFEVAAGETLGIIGRNGAGKSTLLKVLSRITPPTAGRATIRGRVATLLEVGTGFHPELTGRENVFLNGSILGMRRGEIRARFDEIVAFSGVERFLDTQLKNFSTGMQLRLAFAVAAFLDPEILIIDEVLAVGDDEFQRRCLGKMEEINRSGRTILFVSHNMNAIRALCSRCMLLEAGRMRLISEDVPAVVRAYLSASGVGSAWWTDQGSLPGNPYFRPRRFGVSDAAGSPVVDSLQQSGSYFVEIEGDVLEEHSSLVLGYALYGEDGALLFWSYHTDSLEHSPTLRRGSLRLRAQLPTEYLNVGTYRLELIGGLHYLQWLFEPGTTVPACTFALSGLASRSPFWLSRRPGLLAPCIQWSRS